MINYQGTPSSGNIVIMIAQETRTDKTNSSINQCPPSHHWFFQSLKLRNYALRVPPLSTIANQLVSDFDS